MQDQKSLEYYQKMLTQALPSLNALDVRIVDIAADGTVSSQLPCQTFMQRPGGAVAGPAIMGLADVGMYIALMVHKAEPLEAFTSHLHIHFLRKAPQGDLLVRAKVLKVGRSSAAMSFDVESLPNSLAASQASGLETSKPVHVAHGSGSFSYQGS